MPRDIGSVRLPPIREFVEGADAFGSIGIVGSRPDVDIRQANTGVEIALVDRGDRCVHREHSVKGLILAPGRLVELVVAIHRHVAGEPNIRARSRPELRRSRPGLVTKGWGQLVHAAPGGVFERRGGPVNGVAPPAIARRWTRSDAEQLVSQPDVPSKPPRGQHEGRPRTVFATDPLRKRASFAMTRGPSRDVAVIRASGRRRSKEPAPRWLARLPVPGGPGSAGSRCGADRDLLVSDGTGPPRAGRHRRDRTGGQERAANRSEVPESVGSHGSPHPACRWDRCV